MTSSRVALAAMLVLASAAVPVARGQRSNAPFDYYLLALSWAPDFCAAPGGHKDPRECAPGRKLGFVVHGLWPQSNQGRGPENCGSVSPVSNALVNLMLNFMPGQSLIQHEWMAHGSCSGESADSYFAAVRKARNAVTVPDAFTSLSQPAAESAAQIEAQFAAANPKFPKSAFRATCSNQALQEVRICFDRNLNPQACTASAGECRDGSMSILPPR